MHTTAYLQLHADRSADLERAARSARLHRAARASRRSRKAAAGHGVPLPTARGPAPGEIDLREPVGATC